MAEVLLLAAGATFYAVLSEEFSNFYNAVKSGVLMMVWCKKYCQELQQDLDELQPILDQICRPDVLEEDKRSLERLKETLAEGRSLVATCLQRGRWVHPFERYRCSNDLLKLRQEILQHFRNLPLLNRLPLHQVNATLQDVSKQLDKNLEDMIHALKSEIAPLCDWLRQGASSNRSTTGNHTLGKHCRLDVPIQEDRNLVGLEDRVEEVKSLLLSGKEEEMVMIVGGMGGIGKTTLAIALCNDPQVKRFFENGIYFFTVSQSPDMKALLSSIWGKVVGEPVPQFQNEEDAYRQVKRKFLSMSSKGCLLVLDDVWSKENLEKLSFEGQGLKTMITTRQAPMLETHQSVTYSLGLLPVENAQRLFCYWAFGEDSIPPWVEDPLVVEEVISECKRLPLALKVIGASLLRVAEFPAAWRNARDKLRQAMSLGGHHEHALQRRLQTSIDALDPKLQECFLDLGAYPEDSLCSPDFLLDVWVYVRGMTWEEAVLALVELGSRCLLDFHPSVTSADVGHALECGNARNIKFSQHDVMRDLALHLGRKNCLPSQRTRLLMPQRGENVPMDWQSDEAGPFAAQLISIRTGEMVKKDWSVASAFPNAEALLLDIAHCSHYTLPTFIQSMCNLKVLSITGPGIAGVRMDGSFEGLGQLQSIDMENVKGILLSLGDMHKLEKLRLSAVDDAGLELFKGQGSLRPLKLCDCQKLRQLPTSVWKIQSSQVLDLNGLDNLKRLPDTLGQLSALRELSLINCDGVQYLPAESLGQLVVLKKLDLSLCRSLEFLPENIGLLTNLEKLSLQGCASLKGLPDSLMQLSCLKELDLGCCGRCVVQLPEGIGDLRCLEDLKLDRWCDLQHLPQSIGLLTCLKSLSLSGCGRLKELPESLGELGCLEYLSLKGCCSLKHLPESFGRLSRLSRLSLEGCYSLVHLPESFGRLSRLRTLNMSRVRLASLPASVLEGGLVGLERVQCSTWSMPKWESAISGQGFRDRKKPRLTLQCLDLHTN